MKLKRIIIIGVGLLMILLSTVSCSTTRRIPTDDKLFVGIKQIDYEEHEDSKHFAEVQEEIEAALSTPPNGALFGSSSIRSPFPFGLWIWNAFSGSQSVFGKWVTKSFGRKPVLLSNVNPALRASVAKQVLNSHGYLRGDVSYQVIQTKNPKKAKVSYTIIPRELFRIDSLDYTGFPKDQMRLLQTRQAAALVRKGDPFDVSKLDAERERISRLFRNQGFFYYQSSYASYLADTLSVPGSVLAHLQLADSLPSEVMRKWYIGRAELSLKKNYFDELRDTLTRNLFTVHYNGKKPPIRPKVILRDLRLFPNRPFRYDNYVESVNKLNASGLYSSIDFKFVPRDTTASCKTLDLMIDCVLEKPYDFYFEANVKGKTSGRLGPGMVLGFAKRNAFRGGEIIEFNLNGNYEWETGHRSENNRSGFNSYGYGGNVSLKIPRLLLPVVRQRSLFRTPMSVIKLSSDILNRAGYFKRHIVSGELTFNWQTTKMSKFEFSPLILQFDYMTKSTQQFQDIVSRSPYLRYSMQDKFIPKLYYSYTYISPGIQRHPIRFQLSFSEAGNVLSLGYLAAGKNWNEKDKKLFKNPYAQFLTLEMDVTKTWRTGEKATLVGHINTGGVWSYGNALMAPYSEQFYVGGANSIRAFNVRTIGPGSYHVDTSQTSYLDQTGDLKLLANLEYRPHLFGNFYGALFLDAGNVWAFQSDYRSGSTFKLRNFFKEVALGTGLGIRYDMQFLVIRFDWGVALHTPYNKGFYNIKSFKEGQSFHFAIGYPF